MGRMHQVGCHRHLRHTFIAAVAVGALLAGCGKPEPVKTDATPAGKTGPFAPDDPEFKRRVQARLDEMKREESVREEAPWFGKTGLPDDVERELPRYLRREFGQLLSQPGALRAQDLQYMGVFTQRVETVHYWRINHGSPEPKFAYFVAAPKDQQVMGWGDRRPPM